MCLPVLKFSTSVHIHAHSIVVVEHSDLIDAACEIVFVDIETPHSDFWWGVQNILRTCTVFIVKVRVDPDGHIADLRYARYYNPVTFFHASFGQQSRVSLRWAGPESDSVALHKRDSKIIRRSSDFGVDKAYPIVPMSCCIALRNNRSKRKTDSKIFPWDKVEFIIGSPVVVLITAGPLCNRTKIVMVPDHLSFQFECSCSCHHQSANQKFHYNK